jgi:hypothetical protein
MRDAEQHAGMRRLDAVGAILNRGGIVAHLLGEGGGRHQECSGQGNWKQLAEHREAAF